MSVDKLQAEVRRVSPFVNVIDIQGEISSISEAALTEAYQKATEGNVRTIILNFSGLQYMNSFGIGMLVTLLVRARRESRQIVSYGLSEHYQKIFQVTRLNQAIPNFESEQVAINNAERMDLPERES